MGSRVWVCTACRGSGIRGWRSSETSCMSSREFFCFLQGKTGSPSKFGSRSNWKPWIRTKTRSSRRSRWPPTASSKASRPTSRASPGVSIEGAFFFCFFFCASSYLRIDADVCAKCQRRGASLQCQWSTEILWLNLKTTGLWVTEYFTG